MKLIRLSAILVFVFFWTGCSAVVQPQLVDTGVKQTQSNPVATPDQDQIGTAFRTRKSDVQVEGEGVVTRILPDDLAGGRHQRLIVKLASEQTVLISHNIDLAQRIEAIREGDRVRFNGEYIWNQQGGIVHWTHRDPKGRHVAGWVEHAGRIYQ